ncbi:XRE family transcriptional regulator [Providencia rettgeri]|uniref:XRE family transcriptional regulator n=2 Tax=Providencia TaxID=586 RepID=UPI00141A51BF|nr:XRE family transcriptional regulator [Providencia rettgeri]NIA76318.1 XRE family transcriptional regulator [Providencia rettgeri]NIA80545.1 XRE family transcriptional regulator [Providencia rettgeri]NIB03751.1 XRE family transcriptional regulator [Providencia rettgeri]NIB07912.1 XRE family transcriptional regulator [Providencia rettgeri]NIB21549.1 XRE family transcriptional regulator [Providencia rettgeri]
MKGDDQLIHEMKKQLLSRISAKTKGENQKEISRILGVSQPRVSDLQNARLDKFSLAQLIVYLNKLGVECDILMTETKLLEASNAGN